MKQLYPQDSIEYKKEEKRFKMSSTGYVMCYKNIFNKRINKKKKYRELISDGFYVPFFDESKQQEYSDATQLLAKTYFNEIFASINNIEAVPVELADISAGYSQIFMGALVMDVHARIALVFENGRYDIPKYKLMHSNEVYCKTFRDLMAEQCFANLSDDLDIYPKVEGENQQFEMTSGLIINTTGGKPEYSNKTLFTTIYMLEDFEKLVVEHKAENKEIRILNLKEAASIVGHDEISNPWLDYIIKSLIR